MTTNPTIGSRGEQQFKGNGRPLTSFFTKGQKLAHKTSYIFINQCYVQYMRPSISVEHDVNATPGLPPILFLHGGGLTGAQWESTPDRRPGWAVLASERGHPVYILDNVDSGRSQAAPAAVRRGAVEHRTCEEVWTRFRLGSTQGYQERRTFEGSQAVLECLDSLVASQAARRRTTDEVELYGIIDAIQEIGRCIVIAHSHGAALVMDALQQIRSNVEKLILVEPGESAVASRLLADIPTLLVWGDFIAEHGVWVKINDSYKHAPVDVLVLPEAGITGNTHFPMLDRNSDFIFQKLLEWLENH